MTLPTVSINPPIAEYYEGDRIELTCTTTGNPAPRITWQRANNRPLSTTTERYDALLVIKYARQDDSGEYTYVILTSYYFRKTILKMYLKQKCCLDY